MTDVYTAQVGEAIVGQHFNERNWPVIDGVWICLRDITPADFSKYVEEFVEASRPKPNYMKWLVERKFLMEVDYHAW